MGGTEMRIRKAKMNDWKDIQYVAEQTWHDTYEGIIESTTRDIFLQTAYNEEMLEKRISSSQFFVAEVEGRVVGFIQLTLKEGAIWDLTALYILPTIQKQGVGTALFNTALERLEVERLDVLVETENKKGLAFYRSKGFEVVNQFQESFMGSTLHSTEMQLYVKVEQVEK